MRVVKILLAIVGVIATVLFGISYELGRYIEDVCPWLGDEEGEE
ncbi:MAG: hypothetical protein Q4B26_16280 [Eubacteriales bacterium]|nr:hypothetical protein [Eubacteriales bacterium]